MCTSLKTILNQYGSTLIKNLKFRENFVLLGEKGLPGDLGKEMVRALPRLSEISFQLTAEFDS